MLKREINSTLSLLCLTFFLATLPLNAQPTDTLYEDSLCEYTWNSDINECPDVLECIYPGLWEDTTIEVPANITHISKDGLKLCLEDVVVTGSAEIIYIMDLSASMNPAYGANAGDPYKKRPEALQAGFQFQIDSAKNSLAGYIGFESDLVQDQLLKPVAVNTAAGINSMNLMVQRLQSWVDLMEDTASGYGTDYREALYEVIDYFTDPGITHDSSQAIIFISDGRPSLGMAPLQSQIDDLISYGIVVYGIYLSNLINDPNAQELINLANQTNGDIYYVPSTSTDTLAKVVQAIVKSLIKPFEPKGLTVRRNFPTPPFSATAVSYQKIADTAWAAVMDKPIPLFPGPNEIEILSIFGVSDGSVPDTTLTFKFYVDVGGDTSYSSECFYCWYRTQMDVFVNNVTVDTLTWQNDSYTIKLFYYGVDSLNQVDIIARTVQKGDQETITITNPTFDGEKYIFEKTVPFAVVTGNATQNNGTTEADFEDLVTFNWVHPDEPMDTAYTDVIVSAPPNRMEIWDQVGDPATLPPSSQYPPPPDIDTLTAGVLADLYAKVFANQKWLDVYETDPNLYKDITWAFVDSATGNPDPTIGTLGPNNVAHTTFLPIKAHHIIKMTATLSATGLPSFSETVNLFIQPGLPDSIYVEATNDMSQADLNNPTQNDPYIMPGNVTTMTKYGIIRDSLGNWIDPATLAEWTSDDPQVVTVSPGPDDEVTINKGTLVSGETVIRAQKNTLKGSAQIETKEYVIDSLRIVYLEGTDTIDIENLVMNTNQDTLLKVLGRRNDFKTWILVSADWAIVPDTGTSVTETPPPMASSEWEVKPAKPATGIIHVFYFGETDTTDFTFTVGPPIWVEFKIITHDSLLIAGQPIEGEVIIRNKDGLVPGLWEYPSIFTANPAYYIDIIDAGVPGTNGYIPYGKTADLLGAFLDSSFFDDTVSVSQKFFNGIDSLTFILYNTGSTVQSPEPDLHQLTVYLDALSDATDPFILKPGPLHYIELTPDTLPPLTPDDPSFIIVAQGYDEFGNYLPNEIFAWSNDSSLFDFNINVNGTQIYIDPSDATDDQEGWIYVTGISNPNVQDSVYIIIIGPKPKLLLAVTDDLNGNGYLDLIRLTFDKPFALQPNYNLGNILIQKSPTENVFLTVDSMTIAPLSNNKKFYLHLNEERSIADGVPQSNWTPELTIDSLDSIQPITIVTCKDGAPPVVWTAVKKVNDIYDRTKDVVTITLSEKFYNADQSAFLNAGPEPVEIFNVWKKSDTAYIKIDSMFAGINLFQDQKDDWTVFKMINGEDLNSKHYININHLNTFVADNRSNIPYITNQKKKVIVKGQQGDINIAPIPIIPNINLFNQNINNPLTPLDPDEINNIIQSQTGTIIVIELMGKIEKAEGMLMVFDAAANLVFSKGTDENFIDDNPDIQNDLQQGGNIVKVTFCWSGCSSRGMKAAPGAYRIIFWVVIKLPKESAGKQKWSENVVVGR